MKKLIVLMALISTQSFAGTINGAKAANLRKALISAGAVAKVYTDASIVQVTRVNCAQNGGIILLPLKCQFIEDGRLVEVAAGAKSEILAKALNEAGAKTISSRMAERTTYQVSAKSVECSTMVVPSMIGCTVK